MAPFWSQVRFETSFGPQNDEKMDPGRPESKDQIVKSMVDSRPLAFYEQCLDPSSMKAFCRAAGLREAY